ncbi:type VI secretion system-associated FHA domain protein TagH [Pseudomonas syringae]|uniref:Type VI secretion system-associated FHA domain protein TagH n=1 Tax=Pseudomonas syringae CC1417 TaxID=1357272 RepID=A0AAU8LFM2_PSESX
MELVFEVTNPLELKEGCARSWMFRDGNGIIGRSGDCDWCIEDDGPHVSRQHARVSHEGGAFYLTDISRNGTVINGTETLQGGEKRRIRQGDTYRLGNLQIRAQSVQCRGELSHPAMPSFLRKGQLTAALDPLDALQARDNAYCVIDELASVIEKRLTSSGVGDQAPVDHEQVRLPELVAAPMAVQPEHFPRPLDGNTGRFWQQFGEALGVDLSAVDAPGCEILAVDVARLFKQCIDSLEHSSATRHELKAELRTSQQCGRDSGSDASDIGLIISQLVQRQPEQAARTITRSFRDSQAHQVALLAGCRAMARSTLEHFSPQRLHWQFEHEGKAWLRTAGSRWRAYVHHHSALVRDDNWSAGLWGRDFVHAYDEQIRLINSL